MIASCEDGGQLSEHRGDDVEPPSSKPRALTPRAGWAKCQADRVGVHHSRCCSTITTSSITTDVTSCTTNDRRIGGRAQVNRMTQWESHSYITENLDRTPVSCRPKRLGLLRSFCSHPSSSSSSGKTKSHAQGARLLVVLLLLLGLGRGLGDTVQITLASLGDAAAALLLVLLQDANLLERLHDLAVDGAGGVDVLGGPAAAVLGGAVDLAEAADTDGLAEVDVASDGRGADVEPVNVLGGELLGGAGLDGVDPTCSGGGRQHIKQTIDKTLPPE